MNPELEKQMISWNAHAGDRIDPVSVALRRLYLRTELCPCGFGPPTTERRWCRQCLLDHEAIETAWNISNPNKENWG